MIAKFDTSAAQGGGIKTSTIILLAVVAIGGYFAYQHFLKPKPQKEEQ